MPSLPSGPWGSYFDACARTVHAACGTSVTPPSRLTTSRSARMRLGEAVSRRRRGARTWLVGAPALVAGLVLAYVLWTGIGSSPARLPVTRLSLPLPAGQQIVQLERSYPLALSSDGAWLAYVADVDGERQLFVRALDQFQSRPVDGTTGARYPFFSPDSRWIGFFADGQLFRVAVAGGPPLAVCAAIPGLGAAWGENGRVTLDHRAAV